MVSYGVLTLAQLEDEITRSLGNRTDMSTRLSRFLNLAQQRLARVKDFEEMRQIENGTFAITSNPTVDKKLSFANVREVYSFRVLDLIGGEARKLKQVSPRLWDKTIPEPEYFARDIPTHYTIWAFVAEMWPVPDIAYAYEARYTAWPTPFVDATPTQVSDYLMKDELLIALATAYAFDSLSKSVEADRRYKVAGQLLSESLNMDTLQPDLELAPARSIFNASSFTPEYWRDPFTVGPP
jgi:hypothetical protein